MGGPFVQYRRLGKTNLNVSAIGLGGIKLDRVSSDEASEAINRALDLGVNFLDDEGQSEVLFTGQVSTLTFAAPGEPPDQHTYDIDKAIVVDVLNVDPTITQMTIPTVVVAGHVFDCSAMATDPGGWHDPLQYYWDFGSAGGTAGRDVQYSILTPGIYSGFLKVNDDDSGVTVSSFSITAISPSATSRETSRRAWIRP